MASSIEHYYRLQAGNGLRHIGHVYRSPRNGYQKGYGIGSFLSNIMGYLRPYAMSGLKSLTSQTYKSGKDVFSDLIENKSLGEIVRTRGKEAVLDLAEQGVKTIKKMAKRQSGSGINRRSRTRRKTVGGKRHKKTKQIGGRRIKRKVKRRTKKKRVLDIFT